MAFPEQATHTLAGLCALWLPSGTSSTEKLQKVTPTTNHLPSSAAAPIEGPLTPTAHCRSCIWPCNAPRLAQGWPFTQWQGSVRCGCRAVPHHLQRSSTQQNCNPHKPPAQPDRSTQCRPHHTCCTLQMLHLTLQWPVACSGLATNTLTGLNALWFLSGAASAEKLQ